VSRYFAFSLEPPFRQSDGVFVLDDDAFCYWPKQSAPGYVIPREMHQNVGNLVASVHPQQGLYGPLKALVASLVALLTLDIARALFGLSDVVVGLAVILVGIAAVVAGLVWWLVVLKKTRKLKALLETCEKIPHPRPPTIDGILLAKTIKIGRYLVRFGFIYLMVCVGIAAMFFVNVPLFVRWFMLIVGLPWVLWGGWCSFRFVFRMVKLRRQPLDMRDHIHPNAEWTDPEGNVIRSHYLKAEPD
jgi:uncharacterized membrane protein YuzA (DUF378 family)